MRHMRVVVSVKDAYESIFVRRRMHALKTRTRVSL
jgi:hypothetical protein